jgi:hypothetical protein
MKTVRYKGVNYPSLSAAARARGLAVYTVHSRLRGGWSLERALETEKPKGRREKRTISYGGATYPTLKAAAEAHGLAPGTLCARLGNGWDLARALETEKPKGRREKRTISYGGATYPTLKAAAEAHGLAPGTLCARLGNGWDLARALETETKESYSKAKSVSYDGTAYPSLKAAAEAHGLAPSVLYARLGNGWDLERALETEKKEGYSKAKSVSYDGTAYPTLKAAAEAHGFAPGVLYARLRLGWSLEEALSSAPRRKDVGKVFGASELRTLHFAVCRVLQDGELTREAELSGDGSANTNGAGRNGRGFD